MTRRRIVEQSTEVESQPHSVQGLTSERRDSLVISMRKVEMSWIVVSRYGDEVWWLTGLPTNVSKTSTKLDFTQVPVAFRTVAKAIIYRMKTRGRAGSKRASASTLISTLRSINLFFQYATNSGFTSLSEITPFFCSAYSQTAAVTRLKGGRAKEPPSIAKAQLPISRSMLEKRLSAVEVIYELSQYTDDPMGQHPWVESSADSLSNYGQNRRARGIVTPLMSDQIFTTLFQNAWEIVESAGLLLDLRDRVDILSASFEGKNKKHRQIQKWNVLAELGWQGGANKFIADLLNIRIACYIVIASLSGCRNHELSYLKCNAYFSTEDDQGETYWWMRSISSKTDEGATQWMIPVAAVQALRIMDRWACPYQALLAKQIENYRLQDSNDVRIAEAQLHLGAIFVGTDKMHDHQVRTISGTHTNDLLNQFAKHCGLSWKFASHQFRRKFANYAARSRFGDLRYLKEHFKHWSFDMTLGYALNESQEMALYLEIEDELEDHKREVVANWLEKSEPLAGGYGNRLATWRSKEEPITLFKDHHHMVRSIAESTAIRSNGHAWCTADDHFCDGNDVNPTRCAGGGTDDRGGCKHAVIGREHAPIFAGLYNQLAELLDCDDIGEGGRARVKRDLERCRTVFADLGHDPLKAAI